MNTPVYPPELFDKIYQEFESITIPYQPNGNRRGSPKHRCCVFGITRERFTGKVGLSRFSRDHPEILKELIRIASIICPELEYNSIQVNRNLVCPPHRDTKNVGASCIVSIGDYVGNNLVIEGDEHDTRYHPLFFDGSKREHWNTPQESGTNYSFIFFKTPYANSIIDEHGNLKNT